MSETELVPAAVDVMDEAALGAFSDMVGRRQQLKEWIKNHEAECKELDSSLTALLTDKGLPKVKHGIRTVSLVASTRSDLSKVKLIEAGVSVQTIAACTTTKSYSYLLVSEEKPKRVEGDSAAGS